MSQKQFQAPRGTSDILPEEQVYWRFLESRAEEVATRFGYERINTPAFENANLFVRSVGVFAALYGSSGCSAWSFPGLQYFVYTAEEIDKPLGGSCPCLIGLLNLLARSGGLGDPKHHIDAAKLRGTIAKAFP